MTDPMPDAYSEESLKLQTGDKSKTLVYRTSEDGGVEAVLKDKTDPLRLSAAHRKAVKNCANGSISRKAKNQFGVIYYSIDGKMTVTHRGPDRWVCLFCRDWRHPNYPKRKGCAHIERVMRWVSEGNDVGEVAA